MVIILAESYLRHPNSYLPRYNIQSETDGESMPLTGKRQLNGLDIGPHQIIESDEEDVQSYGFPLQQKRRNNRIPSDIDLALSHGGEFRVFFLRLLRRMDDGWINFMCKLCL